MGIIDRLFGGEDEREPRGQSAPRQPAGSEPARQLTDEQAIARYRYLLQTAPPEAIEQAHEEAFAQLTPQQRRMVLEQLARAVPEYERVGDASLKDDPRSLARMATRAELRQPGTMERLFGGMGGGVGMGGLMASSFLGGLAGMVVGSMIVQPFLSDAFGAGDSLAAGEAVQSANAAGGEDIAADLDSEPGDAGDLESDLGGDFGADFGGDFGDLDSGI